MDETQLFSEKTQLSYVIMRVNKKGPSLSPSLSLSLSLAFPGPFLCACPLCLVSSPSQFEKIYEFHYLIIRFTVLVGNLNKKKN